MSNTGLAPLDTDANDAKRGYGVGDAHRRGPHIGGRWRGRHIGGRWRGRLAAPEPRQRRHPEPEGRLACRAGRSGVAEYGPAHGDQAKGIPLRHLHDAIHTRGWL